MVGGAARATDQSSATTSDLFGFFAAGSSQRRRWATKGRYRGFGVVL